jgi:uncharacterized protein involved in type VI secretion and phage assembly
VRAGGPRTPTQDGGLCGIYYGVVTQNKDTDKGLARVKVKLPWLDNSDSDQAYWAQLSTPMAGDKFGFYTLPDVGDTVAVMFIAGDINYPVVLGGVWSKTDKTPEDGGGGKNDFRGYRSRAGSRIIMDDSSNSKVVMADKTNKNVVAVGAFAKSGDGPNASDVPRPGDAGSGGVLVAAMDGKMNITCKNGKLTVTAQMAVKVQAQNAVEMKAGADLTFDGGMTQVIASSPANLDGSSTKIGP